MKSILIIPVPYSACLAQEAPSLRGTVTDPSGAAVPGAVVQVRGPGGEQRARTDRRATIRFLRSRRASIRSASPPRASP